jgi:ActR/RegA family two-component response regulator
VATRSIATLGPPGTCSEEVALAYLDKLGQRSPGDLVLTESFEGAVALVLGGSADEAIVPAAYIAYNDIVFENAARLHVGEILYSRTPAFVLCARAGTYLAKGRHQYTIASHPSPAPLLQGVKLDFKVVHASSNAGAARLLAEGSVDLCLTNLRAFETTNLDPESPARLEVVELFGAVDMVWSVFRRGQRMTGTDFWQGRFSEGPDVRPVSILEWMSETGLESDAARLQTGAARISLEGDHWSGTLNDDLPGVLLVDDDVRQFEYLPGAFRQWEWRYAADADAAEEHLSEPRLTAAILDISLDQEHAEDESGVALLARVRARRPELNVLMITGYGRDAEIAARCFRLGALDYLRKPPDPKRLSGWLHLLERRWKRRNVPRAQLLDSGPHE